jgi:hypothetical protein
MHRRFRTHAPTMEITLKEIGCWHSRFLAS